jgi:Carboxypeptidase regulatory-like domain
LTWDCEARAVRPLRTARFDPPRIVYDAAAVLLAPRGASAVRARQDSCELPERAMKHLRKAIGALAAAMLLGSGSCVLACGCERPPSGAVRGSVRTEAGDGVPGAALELRARPVENWTHTVVSGADGSFSFPVVPALSDYTLTVQPPAGWALAPGQDATASFRLGAEQTVEARFTLRAR